MEITKKKWFAWYPIKTPDGWVWLEYVWKETRTELRPMLRFIVDEKYRKTIIKNLERNQTHGKGQSRTGSKNRSDY